jgi:hypothetical protein
MACSDDRARSGIATNSSDRGTRCRALSFRVIGLFLLGLRLLLSLCRRSWRLRGWCLRLLRYCSRPYYT